MTGKLNLIFQGIAVFFQGTNATMEIIPEDYRGIVISIVALIQAILVKIAIDRNADGTPSTVAYKK